jgi:hypothetical protein
MTASPLLRAGTFDLKVVPPRLPQPPPEQDERARERAEDATLRARAVPRRALRPNRVSKPLLEHVVVLIRRRIGGNHACERSVAHWGEKLENIRDLRFFGEDRGRVTRDRVRT